MTRILHVAKVKGVAGAEGHLLRLLPGLKAAGFEVRMLVLHPLGNTVPEFTEPLRQAGIDVELMPIGRHLSLGLIPKLWRYLRRVKPDILHTHMLHADLYGLLAAFFMRLPIISSRHNDDNFRRQFVFRLAHWLYWKRVKHGLAISEAMRQFTIKIEHAAPRQIQTIHYGLDFSEPQANYDRQATHRTWGLPEDAVVVGSVCRLIEQKGVGYAIKAFHKVHARVPNAHYIIAGDGVLRDELVALTHALDLQDVVHFLGWQSDTGQVFVGLDVFLAPSLWEGFGLVFLEAMHAGLPIISTRTSAIPEIVVDGVTGYLVPPADDQALIEPITHLLSEPSLAQTLGKAGHQRLIDHFSQAQMIEKTAMLYQTILGN